MNDKIRHLWYLLCRYVFVIIPDRLFVQITALITYSRLGFPYKPYNLSKPVSFNEKITKFKINPCNIDLSSYADKIEVRKYIKSKIGEEYLVPLLGIYKSANEIDFETLPQKFVLKANHGSGWNIICGDKNKLDFNETRRKLVKWLNYNAFYLSREYQYKYITPAIICEKMIGVNIYDYKFFCFNGEPKIVQVDIDRFTNHRRAFFNMEWEKQAYSIRYPISEREVDKPIQLKDMIEICRELSSLFPFVRVDLYLHHSRIYFGELTFIPGGGNEPFNPVEADYSFGKLFII